MSVCEQMSLRRRTLYGRRLGVERLEPRAMLAATLPDLVVWSGPSAGLHDAYLQSQGNGQEWLRFSNMVANAGAGALAVYWGPPNGNNTQPAYQRVYNADRTYIDYLVGSFVYHPTHSHTHFEGFSLYNLRAVNADGSPGAILSNGQKTSFCITDSRVYNGSLPGTPASRVYSCSTQGISVGWADIYSHSVDGQYINVTSIPTGDYWLESIANPDLTILESDATNNASRVRLHIDREARTVRVVGSSGITQDLYEDNDSQVITDTHPAGLANSPNLGVVTGTRTIPNLNMEDGTDWYRLETNAAATTSHQVRIDFQNSQGNLGLRLRDSTGAVLLTSDGTGNSETISLSGKPRGAYYAEVFAAAGVTNPDYTLTIAAPVATAGILPDDYEDNDTKGTVDALPPGELHSSNLGQFIGQRTFTGLTMEDGFDWYKFQTTSAGTSSSLVRISFTNSQGDLDVRLRNSSGTVLATANGTGNSETISLNGRSGGLYYVEVFGYRGANNPSYALTIDAPAGSGGFAADAYENNDSRTIVDARGTVEPNSPNLGAVSGTRTITSLNMEDGFDWYKFQLTSTGSSASQVRIDFLHAQGDLGMRLRNSAGTSLTTRNGAGNSEIISLSGRPTGSYYIEVFGYRGATNPNYTLTITTPATASLQAATRSSPSSLTQSPWASLVDAALASETSASRTQTASVKHPIGQAFGDNALLAYGGLEGWT